jgi:hypothetical protein
MAPPLLVDALKIRMPQQSPAAWILLPAPPLQIRRSLRSKRAHGSLTIRLQMLCKSLRMTTLWDPRTPPGEKSKSYSRKPGFTETRLRPFARRRDNTAAPLLVFMRVRNPCFFERLRRLGWKVRLGMKNGCS